MLKKILGLFSLVLVLIMCSCSDAGYYGGYYNEMYAPNDDGLAEEEYNEINERGFYDPKVNPLSSFSLDSSSYAYSNLRRLILNNSYISKDAVVIEQMLNYFNYSYTNDSDNALSTSLELAPNFSDT